MLDNKAFREIYLNEISLRNIPNFDIDAFEQFTINAHANGFKENLYQKIEEMLRMHTIVEIVDMFLHSYSYIDPSVSKYAYRLRNFTDEQKTQFKEILGRNHTPCFAPLTSLDFHINGSISICCLTKGFPVGMYPTDTIHDVWFGKALDTYNKQLKEFNFPTPCTRCVHQVLTGNKENAILNLYEDERLDILIPDNVNKAMFKAVPQLYKHNYPTMFTFQLSDVCNYECIMCGGGWSSSIRKNREKRVPFKPVYDDNFVEQLREFMPHLKKLYLVGGEPLMTSINYKIMDLAVELNPDIHLYITTNGSVLNTRIKDLLKKLPNLKIIASIDSINPDTYKVIRKNGNLETVMANLDYFHKQGRLQAFAICPMIQNIYEIHDLLDWCIEKGIGCWFNIVEFPLGGYIKGIHEFPTTNIETFYDLSTSHIYGNDPTVNVDLPEKLPLVALNTLPLEERIKIKTFLESRTYTGEFQLQINGLIAQVMSDGPI